MQQLNIDQTPRRQVSNIAAAAADADATSIAQPQLVVVLLTQPP